MQVRISKLVKSATQSAFHCAKWQLEFVPNKNSRWRIGDSGPLTSTDMQSEVKINFDDLTEAIAFAEANFYQYEVVMPKLPKLLRKNYAANFK